MLFAIANSSAGPICGWPRVRRLPAAKPADMSHSGAARGKPGGRVETRLAVKTMAIVQPGKAVRARVAWHETWKPADGIAKPVIRPVIVGGSALGLAAAPRRDTAIIGGEGVAGRACRHRHRFGGGAAQYGRGRERGGRVGRRIRGRHRNELGAAGARHSQCRDQGEGEGANGA